MGHLGCVHHTAIGRGRAVRRSLQEEACSFAFPEPSFSALRTVALATRLTPTLAIE